MEALFMSPDFMVRQTGVDVESQNPKETEVTTKEHKALGVLVGAASETASEMAHAYGSMGITDKKWLNYGNATAILVIVLWVSVGAPIAFFWLRADAKDDRNEYRLQVIRQEQLAEERRREDRIDRQRQEDMFKTTLEVISRDSRESVQQMRVVSEQVRSSSEQMKMATEAMVKVEKAISAKMHH
jgi:hypothetical protein